MNPDLMKNVAETDKILAANGEAQGVPQESTPPAQDSLPTGGTPADNGAAAAEAGAQGEKKRGKGRPPTLIPIGNSFFTYLGQPLPFLRWGGKWYIYPDGMKGGEKGEWADRGSRWVELKEGEEYPLVMKWTQRAFPERATPQTVKFILGYVNSLSMCALPQGFKMPCWVGGDAGERGAEAWNWWNMENGLVNIKALVNGAMPENATREHTPLFFATSAHEYPFDPAAACPRWMQFLNETLPNEGDRLELQMMFGLCLMPIVRFEVFFLLYGNAGTGKSTAVNVLKMLVGEKCYSELAIEDICEKHAQHVLTEVLVNVCSEFPATFRRPELSQAEAQIKRVTSGEGIKCEPKNLSAEYKKPIARLVCTSNTLPSFTDKSDGLWRRLRIIPFEVNQYDRAEVDNDLTRKLKAELPGVFLWAVDGLRKLSGLSKFPHSPRGAEILRLHKERMDPVGTWLKETFEKYADGEVDTKEGYSDYKEWCETQNENPLSAAKFAAAVDRVFNVGAAAVARWPASACMGKSFHRVWKGIRKKEVPFVPDDDVELY